MNSSKHVSCYTARRRATERTRVITSPGSGPFECVLGSSDRSNRVRSHQMPRARTIRGGPIASTNARQPGIRNIGHDLGLNAARQDCGFVHPAARIFGSPRTIGRRSRAASPRQPHGSQRSGALACRIGTRSAGRLAVHPASRIVASPPLPERLKRTRAGVWRPSFARKTALPTVSCPTSRTAFRGTSEAARFRAASALRSDRLAHAAGSSPESPYRACISRVFRQSRRYGRAATRVRRSPT